MSASIRVDQLDEMLQKSWGAGVRSARIAAWWCLMEPERDRYFWDDMDYALQIASNYGIQPVPEVFNTPDWATAGGLSGVECVHSPLRNWPPADMNDWSDFMEDFVARYGVYGRDQVHHWEIWNEPDLWEFLYAPDDPENSHLVYAEMIKRARQAIDANDVGGRLMLGGMSDIVGPKYLDKLLDLTGPLDIRGDIDIVAIHAYSQHANKLDRMIGPVRGRDLDYELWVNELNTWGWDEHIQSGLLTELFDVMWSKDISRTFWFKSWTTDWGPGIFVNRDPLWEPGPFTPSAFYDTFKNQTFPHTLSAAPDIVHPNDNAMVDEAGFVWNRPDAGTFPIVGYKLQVDDSLFRGQPYFHTPEVDAWIPAVHLQFTPIQMANGADIAFAYRPKLVTTQVLVPAIEHSTYQPPLAMTPGLYRWRIAAVDSDGNVGPYTPPRVLIVAAGKERLFFPYLAQ